MNETATTALYTFGVNGSGVDMRCPVEILTVDGDTAEVRFLVYVPSIDRLTETAHATDPARRTVRSDRFTAPGTAAPLASFNRLD